MFLNNVNHHGILWICGKWSVLLFHYKCVVPEFQWDEMSSLVVEKGGIKKVFAMK